jgi:hypothetical protein
MLDRRRMKIEADIQWIGRKEGGRKEGKKSGREGRREGGLT